jgi:pteridine reductase
MKGKTALITGAARRIGKSVAVHLAANGWNVLVHYNSSPGDALDLVKSLLEQYPDQAFEAVRSDLSLASEVEKLIPEVVAEHGKFELLINNASVFTKGHLYETSTDLLYTQLNVNLIAPFILTRDFARHCRKGNIINFVDTRITSNKSDFIAYSLSKKGLWEATKMAALELAPAIRINAIAPGVTIPPNDKDGNYLTDLAEKIPMRRPGGILPILKSIDYILENDHLTGQLLFADGGENLGYNI